MIKILHLTQTDIRNDSRILKEMRSAYHNNFDVYGVGMSLNEIETEKSKDIDYLNVMTLNIISNRIKSLPKPIKHTLTLLEFLAKSTLYSISLKPDIIHCNDTLVLPIGVFIKFFTKSKLVYDAHELESNRNGLSKNLGKATLLVEKKLWKYVDGLIVVSPSIQKWYIDNIGHKKSTIVLNSPVFESLPNVKSTYLRDKFSIPKDDKIFIYIGILGTGRGIDLILESFKNVDNAHVVFLGYGDYFERLAELEKLHSNIHLHDAVEHHKVVEIASSADVGLCLIENVSLSDYYCLPNKLFEYIFGGLPVLASNFPDISYVVEKYSLGVCVDLDTQSIKEGIDSFASESSSFDIEQHNLSDLSWQKQESNLISLYKVL